MMRTTIAALALTLGLAASAHAETGYDNGFYLSATNGDADFKLQVNAQLQFRLATSIYEAGPADYAYSIPRARLVFTGHILTKRLTYQLQLDFGTGDAGLKDFFANYVLADGFQLRAGQYKKPFSRQQIASIRNQALVDRAITDRLFASGRDLGLTAHNGLADGFQWAAGVFNGTGDKGKFAVSGTGDVTRSNIPQQFEPEVVVRLGYSGGGFGPDAFVEGDLKCGAGEQEGCGVRWAVGASAIIDPALADDGDEGEVQAQLDLALKASGFGLNAALYLDNNLGDSGGLENLGFHAQASYYLASARLLPAIRYAMILPEDSDTGTTLSELTLGIGYHPWGHNIKWQTDVSMLGADIGDAGTTTWQVRSQLQFAF